MLRDRLIANKGADDLRNVFAPKVAGSCNLLDAVAPLAPDFLALFGSTAGVHGNLGQADYAAANAFQDALAAQPREGATRIVSLAWPLWRDGGMGLDPAAEAGLRRRTGLAPMPTAAGLQALYDVLAAGETHAMVLHGEAVRLRGGHPVRQQAEPSAPVDAAVSEDRVPGDLASRVLAALTGLIAKHLRIPKDRIRPGELLETYGVDSLNGTELNQQLEDIFPGLSRTIFYEYPRFAELADHLVAEYPDTCAVWAGVAVKTATPAPLKPAPMQPAPMVARSATPAPAVRIPRSDTTSGAEPVAVIGISARFPAAEDVEAFYANLLAGRESISEVPADRWAWRTPAGADPAGEAGRWGGFLDNAYGFDPLFFGITPRDAARIDPQERLFLQEAWHALEDAGYAPACLPDDVKANGGVFAGITKQGFNLWAAEGEYLATSFSSMVNRVSHHLDLRGPSLAFDTMCSSALVALHEACDFLRNRGGRIALVGGVNLYLHPHNFDGLAAGQSLAPGRHCTAFAADGTGFVPGEGVGALVLKPYADALRDGDDIQAMIRASAVSHAGARGGYGTPNPAQQEAVIRAALAQADIDPRTITYIESAANGQAAADAVEMTALSKAFALRDGANGDYRVGSVKPNIGHAESASGVAQLAKVLMALKHRRIPATLLHGVRNPNIAFDRLPFALQTEMGRWHRVAIDGAEVPRRAEPCTHARSCRVTGFSSSPHARRTLWRRLPDAGSDSSKRPATSTPTIWPIPCGAGACLSIAASRSGPADRPV